MMKKILILLVLFLVSGKVQAEKWQYLRNGIAYQIVSFTKTPQETFKLHIFKIDPKQYRFKPVLSPSGTRQSVKSFAEKYNALIAVNSNFFDIEHKPLGLVIQNGKTLNPFKKISWWGVFYIKKMAPLSHVDDGFRLSVFGIRCNCQQVPFSTFPNVVEGSVNDEMMSIYQQSFFHNSFGCL